MSRNVLRDPFTRGVLDFSIDRSQGLRFYEKLLTTETFWAKFEAQEVIRRKNIEKSMKAVNAGKELTVEMDRLIEQMIDTLKKRLRKAHPIDCTTTTADYSAP